MLGIDDSISTVDALDAMTVPLETDSTIVGGAIEDIDVAQPGGIATRFFRLA